MASIYLPNGRRTDVSNALAAAGVQHTAVIGVSCATQLARLVVAISDGDARRGPRARSGRRARTSLSFPLPSAVEGLDAKKIQTELTSSGRAVVRTVMLCGNARATDVAM